MRVQLQVMRPKMRRSARGSSLALRTVLKRLSVPVLVIGDDKNVGEKPELFLLPLDSKIANN